jgi:hypothetical protein
MGANLDWLRKEYNAGILLEVENTVATAAAPAPAVNNDADSMALVFVNFGTFDIFLTLAQNAPAGSGIKVVANGGEVSLTVRDDFTLPSRGWFAASPGGASSLYTLRLRVEVPADQFTAA